MTKNQKRVLQIVAGTEPPLWHVPDSSLSRDRLQGAGDAQTLKALERRGWIEFSPEYRLQYWSRITESGRAALEKESEREKSKS